VSLFFCCATTAVCRSRHDNKHDVRDFINCKISE
jgi:hypothetical protein